MTGDILASHFSIVPVTQGDACWSHAKIRAGRRNEVVRLLAIEIVQRLCGPSDFAFDAWTSRAGGGAKHDAATREEIEAYVLADFADPGNDTRLQGAVVEHLWACIASELAGGWGKPLLIEHEHFSVIDHGGDGLSIYEAGSSDLRFRLWESKRHDSATKSVTTVVTGAADQLKSGATSYLARMSKPLQLNRDPRVRQLGGRIVRLWTTRDVRCSVGVSVGTTKPSLPARPFLGLGKVFAELPGPEHREGLIIELVDLEAFASSVRAAIMTGID